MEIAPVEIAQLDITALLNLRTWRAFDVDDEGRVLAGWDDSGSVQLVEISPDGTHTPLTNLPGSCTGRYLPGERCVVVQHDDGGNERGQLSLLYPEDSVELVPLVHDPAYIHSLTGVLPGRVVYRTNRANGVDFDVVLRNVSTGVEQVLYAGGGNVAEVAVSPDSRYTVVVLVGTQPVSTQLLLVDALASTPDAQLAELTGAEEHAAYANIHWLPDSTGFVLTTNTDRDMAAVARYDLGSTELTWLVTDDAHELTGWLSADGATLLVETNNEGWSELARHDGHSGARVGTVTLPSPGVVTSPYPDPRFSPDGSTVAMSLSAPDIPGDVLLLDVGSGDVRPLPQTGSGQTGSGLAGTVAPPQVHRIPAADGEQIPCFSYAPTAETPLAGSSVTLVHGGPEGQSRPSFNPIVAALTAAGHTVVVPNVRGSAGYGKRWVSLDDGRLRLDSVEDLAAVHDWLPTLGCDPARAALWGGSYGGYMVLAGCAFQPDRWAAGVDIVGMSSLVTFLENTSPYRRAAREREYGTLEHDRDFLELASPLRRIDDVAAALLVIHGANDPRVPLSEAQQLHAALTARGVTCELLVYADEGHGLAKRVNRLDAYPRAVEFLAAQLA